MIIAAIFNIERDREELQGRASSSTMPPPPCQVSLVQSRDIEEARAALQGALEDRSELQAKLEAAHEKALGLQEQAGCHGTCITTRRPTCTI